MRRVLAAAGLVAALVAVPALALAQAGGVSGLLVRVQGDVVVGDGEGADLVLVVNGDVEVQGRAAAVVVIGGTARLSGAQVGQLVVIRGSADLERGTVVEGDVWLAWAGLEQASGATVAGTVHRGVARFGWSWLTVSPLLSVGLGLMVVAVGLLAVTLAPRRLASAAGGLTADFAGAATWALLLFVAGPGLAALVYFTVVGLPVALAALGLLLPGAILAGFAVAGLRLGTWVLRSRATPYGSAALGSALLLALGLVPLAGPIVVGLAAALGAGALARTWSGGASAAAAEAALGPDASPTGEQSAGEGDPASPAGGDALD